MGMAGNDHASRVWKGICPPVLDAGRKDIETGGISRLFYLTAIIYKSDWQQCYLKIFRNGAALMKKIIIPFLLIVLFLIGGCQKTTIDTYNQDFFAMDTYITVQIVTDDIKLAEAGFRAVEKAFLSIDHLTNRFQSDSEVTAVNEQAGIGPVQVSKDVFALVETSLEWSDKTEGVFNILVGSVMDLWGFGTENSRIPAEAELAAALDLMDLRAIILDDEKSTIYLPEKGMVLDLGGVAKGYATDKAVEVLNELGIKNALINAGGNVYALGKKADGTAWKVGVQAPRDRQGIAAVLVVSDTAVVTSGDYERYFEADGIRYHHIIDPVNGHPARASAGTTIIMESATAADILSTVVFIKGPVEGIRLAEEITQIDAAMVITADGGEYGTQSLEKYLAGH